MAKVNITNPIITFHEPSTKICEKLLKIIILHKIKSSFVVTQKQFILLRTVSTFMPVIN